MKGKRCTPNPGQVYRGSGSSYYRCLRSGGVIPARSAILRNVESKWTFVAVGCTLHPDGSLSWCYSTKGRFADSDEDVRKLHCELYTEALEGAASPKIKNNILKQAAVDPGVDAPTMKRIMDAAAFSWT